MNRAAGGFALIVLLAGNVVAAQTVAPAQPSPSPGNTPSTQDPSTTESSLYT